MSTEANNPGEEQNVIADYANELRQIEMEGYAMAVRKARNALFWAGGLIFFWEMIGMFRAGQFDPVVFAFVVVEAGVFVALAFWTKTKPYTAILLGLAVFIGFIVLGIVINGLLEGSVGVLKGVFSGIIVKVIILVNLILPLQDARALQAAKNQSL
jgi:hypothetical protein